MTENDAIRMLTEFVAGGIVIAEPILRKGYGEKWASAHTQAQVCEAIEMAVDALDKQIPYGTVIVSAYEDFKRCPMCGNKPRDGAEYCDGCGQRLVLGDE